MIVYIILIVIILFGAIPFATIEALINSMIYSVNVLMNLLASLVNGVIVLLIGVAYGVVNAGVGTLWEILNDVLIFMGPFVPIEAAPLEAWTLALPYIDFSLFIGNRLLSPIGLFLYSIIGDAYLSNIIGGIALGSLAILVIMVAIKTRK